MPTGEDFLYLAMVLDVFSLKVAGWVLGSRQTAALVQSAPQMSLQFRSTRGMILHSDRGIQYASLASTPAARRPVSGSR